MQTFQKTSLRHLSLQFELRRFFASNLINKQFNLNPLKNAIKFENQSSLWTFDEFEKHSNAFAYGLVELGYKQGDKIAFWLEKSYTSEILSAQVGCAKAGVSIVPLKIKQESELERVLNETKCKGLIFSPNSKVESTSYKDILENLIPEMASTTFGTPLQSKKFSQLQHIIHPTFYSINGTLKYRQILVYATKNFNTLKLPKLDQKFPLFISGDKSYSLDDLKTQQEKLNQKYGITPKENILVFGDCKFPLQFSLGILNTLNNGNPLLMTGNMSLEDSTKLLKYYTDSFLFVDGDILSTSAKVNPEGMNAIKRVVIGQTEKTSKLDAQKIFEGKNPENVNVEAF